MIPDGYLDTKNIADFVPEDGYGIIYSAWVNNKFYIGQTIKSFVLRIKRHYSDAFNPNKSTLKSKFHRAIRKYGNKIIWEIINVVKIDDLDKEEISEIQKHDSFNNGYNSTIGGAFLEI